MLIERMLLEIESLDDVPADYLLAKLADRLAEYQAFTESEALDNAAAAIDKMLERTLTYGDQLRHMDVPPHEKERHDRLLVGFGLYEEALSRLSDALVVEPDIYETAFLVAIKEADLILKQHRLDCSSPPGLDALI